VKIFLHISRDEQRKRFQSRLDNPDERWKFRVQDLEDRKMWDDYTLAYQEAIGETSVKHAPWYIVPADHKWVRNLVVTKLLVHTLERIDPRFPEPQESIVGLTVV
jgi:polyphosphate kinase 2 (PPK2 family)